MMFYTSNKVATLYPFSLGEGHKVFYSSTTVNWGEANLYKELFELALHNPEMKDSIYNPEEIAKLKEIAQLCPFVEGNAVYMARVILHSVEPEKDYVNYCEIAKKPERTSSERRAKNNTKELGFMVESYTAYQIVPNPNNGNFTLQCPNNQGFSYSVYDAKGSIVNNGKEAPNANSVSLNLSNLSKGLYNLVITNDYNERVSLKFNIIE